MTDGGPQPEEKVPYPFGFKLFVVLAGLYLLLRLVQGVQWLIDRFGSSRVRLRLPSDHTGCGAVW